MSVATFLICLAVLACVYECGDSCCLFSCILWMSTLYDLSSALQSSLHFGFLLCALEGVLWRVYFTPICILCFGECSARWSVLCATECGLRVLVISVACCVLENALVSRCLLCIFPNGCLVLCVRQVYLGFLCSLFVYRFSPSLCLRLFLSIFVTFMIQSF